MEHVSWSELARYSVPIVAIIGGLMIAAISIIGGIMSSTKKTRQREETKREVAAYVAERSMTTDAAERLPNAGEAAD